MLKELNDLIDTVSNKDELKEKAKQLITNPLPCPLCQSEAKLIARNGTHLIMCTSCKLTSHTMIDKRGVLGLWNLRDI